MHDGLMVGFWVPRDDRWQLAVPGHEPADELHLTLAYLGKQEDLPPDTASRVLEVVQDFAQEAPKVAAQVTGLGRFSNVEDGTADAIYAEVEGPLLVRFRTELVAALARAGIEATGHGADNWVPHITLAFVPRGAPSPVEDVPSLAMTFDELTVTAGPFRSCVRLQGYWAPSFRLTAEVRKLDDARQLVFGWANIAVTKGGKQIVDLHGESIDVEDLESAAYDFVLNFADVGANDMHDGPLIGKPVESMVFTTEKLRALATDPRTGKVDEAAFQALSKNVPQGWWVGFKLERDAYELARCGERPMLSIEGFCVREAA